MTKVIGLGEKICKVCGKSFFSTGGQHVYRVMIDGKVWNCCSYTCYKVALDLKEKLHNEKIHKREQSATGSEDCEGI